MKQSQRIKHIVTQPETNLLFGKVIPASKVLVLSPHCDDEALGFAGSILKYLADGTEVKVIYLSNDPEKKRVQEAEEAWKNYPISLEFLGVPDSFISDHEETLVEKIYEAIVEFQPEIVAVPWFFDKHIDHVACNIILCSVIEKLRAQENQSVSKIISYEVNFPLYLNYSVNITDVFEQKKEILRSYKSQKPEKIIRTIEALNQFRAEQMPLRSVKLAEGLYVCSPAEYYDLLKLHIT